MANKKQVITWCCVAVVVLPLLVFAVIIFWPSKDTPGEKEAKTVSAEELTMEEALTKDSNEVNLYEIWKREQAAKAQAEADSLAQLQAASVAE